MWGGGRLSHRKHRSIPFHGVGPLSGDAKRHMLRTIAALRPRRVTATAWFATVREALAPRKKKTRAVPATRGKSA